jgi:hypothetical protein
MSSPSSLSLPLSSPPLKSANPSASKRVKQTFIISAPQQHDASQHSSVILFENHLDASVAASPKHLTCRIAASGQRRIRLQLHERVDPPSVNIDLMRQLRA